MCYDDPSLSPARLSPKAPECGSGVLHKVIKVSCPTLSCSWASICGHERITRHPWPLPPAPLPAPSVPKPVILPSDHSQPASSSHSFHSTFSSAHTPLIPLPLPWLRHLHPSHVPHASHMDLIKSLVIMVKEELVVSGCW